MPMPVAHITLFAESLDLSRFDGEVYDESSATLFQVRNIEISILASSSRSGLRHSELVQRWRNELWPGIPVVFAMVDEVDYARLKPANDVTGNILKTVLADSIGVARAVVPDLETIVFVGDRWDRQNVFGSWGLRYPWPPPA